MSRVLFAGGGTGGHLYPALALASAMRDQSLTLRIHFVGAQRGVESLVLPDSGFDYTLLPFEPIRRSRVWRNWRLVPSAFGAVRGLSRLFQELEPDLVVATGGYAAGPAGAWAVLKGVPLALQEQNSYPGLTTRWLSRRARRVYLGFPEAAKELKPGPDTEVLVHGNPIRPPDLTWDRRMCRRGFALEDEGVVVLVVGGSQGSRALNEALLGALEGPAKDEWPDGLQILWSTGPAHIERVRERLDATGHGDRVRTLDYIETMPRAMAASDLAISRAGAMVTAELLAWSIPSILVPLPTAAADHQAHNAAALAEAGAALCISERELSPTLLWQELCTLVRDEARRATMAERARERSNPDAADRIASSLFDLIEEAW